MTEEKDRAAPDVKRVIAGLEYCMGGCQVSCFDCPYREIGQPPPDCLDNCGILKDAVELLKEQEPVHIQKREFAHMWFWCCGSCGVAITEGDRFCRMCGRAVKWDDKCKSGF